MTAVESESLQLLHLHWRPRNLEVRPEWEADIEVCAGETDAVSVVMMSAANAVAVAGQIESVFISVRPRIAVCEVVSSIPTPSDGRREQ